jgi:hypothetical protein
MREIFCEINVKLLRFKLSCWRKNSFSNSLFLSYSCFISHIIWKREVKKYHRSHEAFVSLNTKSHMRVKHMFYNSIDWSNQSRILFIVLLTLFLFTYIFELFDRYNFIGNPWYIWKNWICYCAYNIRFFFCLFCMFVINNSTE